VGDGSIVDAEAMQKGQEDRVRESRREGENAVYNMAYI
jgi:hypothetical protein